MNCDCFPLNSKANSCSFEDSHDHFSWIPSVNCEIGDKLRVTSEKAESHGFLSSATSSIVFNMSRPFPYAFISCPCADTPVPDHDRRRTSRESPQKAKPNKPILPQAEGDEDEEEKTFDPRSPRSNFSLYPPEQLLYCEDCHQIKCPRCITEEIVCWYCPNCLFETPSSMVRSEGNRWVECSDTYNWLCNCAS